MDWRTRAMIIASAQLILVRLRLILIALTYLLARRPICRTTKRKRGYSYSMLGRLPKQVDHMRDLVNINDTDCVDILRMDRNSFHKLCYLLEHGGGLTSCKYVNVQEMTAGFLQTLAHHDKNRVVRFNFKRSGQTVSHYFHKTMDALFKIADHLLVTPTPITSDCTDERWNIFPGCLGALDGTHIAVWAPLIDKERYRTRKGFVSTNVLGVCDINKNFVYILAGWEGPSSDSNVLREALVREGGLKVPAGQYYLCDLGYMNGDDFLAPFKGRRYHLNEWSNGRNRPRDREDFFNMKHSKARNVIECAFGLLKIRWPILDHPTHYSVEAKCNIVLACALLHNFIRLHMKVDPLEASGVQLPFDPPNETDYIDSIAHTSAWHAKRNGMASEMFNNWRLRRPRN